MEFEEVVKKKGEDFVNVEGIGSGRVKWKVLEKLNNENRLYLSKLLFERYLRWVDFRCN